MGIVRRHLGNLTAIAILSTFSILAAACSLVSSTRADCNVVRLQREAGRSDSDIASALSVAQGDVEKCGAAPAEMFGGAGGTGEAGSAASGAEGAAAQPGSGAEGSVDSGSSSSSPY